MSPEHKDLWEFKKELTDLVREVGTWRARLQTVLGLVHDTETDGERAVAAGLTRRLHDQMLMAGKRIQGFARHLGELAEQLERQAAAASDGLGQQPQKE
jgi:hypothetical protein